MEEPSPRSTWENYRMTVFFPGCNLSKEKLMLQCAMAIWKEKGHLIHFSNQYTAAKLFKDQLDPRPFQVISFSPFMSDLSLFNILNSSFQHDHKYLRCKPFLNPMLLIEDLSRFIKTDALLSIEKCRKILMEHIKEADERVFDLIRRRYHNKLLKYHEDLKAAEKNRYQHTRRVLHYND